MNISFERIFGTKPCNNKNYYTVLLPYKSDKIRYKSILFPLFEVIIRIITSKEFDYNPKAVGLRVIIKFFRCYNSYYYLKKRK